MIKDPAATKAAKIIPKIIRPATTLLKASLEFSLHSTKTKRRKAIIESKMTIAICMLYLLLN